MGKRDSCLSEFERADRLLDVGRPKEAFAIFKRLAESGDDSAALNLGFLCDLGIGTRKDTQKALYWYRRAWKHGEASGAHNIGTIHRDRGNLRRAAEWFHRAAKVGNDGSLLEIAKLELKRESPLAAQLLKRVIRSPRVCEQDVDEAKALLLQHRATAKRVNR